MRDEESLHTSQHGPFPADEAADRTELDATPATEQERRFDCRVAEVLRDVRLPAGLEGRIMARLSTEKSAGGGRAMVLDSESGAAQADSKPCRVATVTRQDSIHLPTTVTRRWHTASGWLATAAAFLLIAFTGYRYATKPSWTLPQVLDEAVAFHVQHPRGAGSAAPTAFPFSRAIQSPAKLVGERIVGLMGREGTAYNISKGKVRATLYVLRMGIAGVPGSPPAKPDSMTGGRCAAAWQEGSLLYVLVVEGGEREYRIVSQRVVT